MPRKSTEPAAPVEDDPTFAPRWEAPEGSAERVRAEDEGWAPWLDLIHRFPPGGLEIRETVTTVKPLWVGLRREPDGVYSLFPAIPPGIVSEKSEAWTFFPVVTGTLPGVYAGFRELKDWSAQMLTELPEDPLDDVDDDEDDDVAAQDEDDEGQPELPLPGLEVEMYSGHQVTGHEARFGGRATINRIDPRKQEWWKGLRIGATGLAHIAYEVASDGHAPARDKDGYVVGMITFFRLKVGAVLFEEARDPGEGLPLFEADRIARIDDLEARIANALETVDEWLDNPATSERGLPVLESIARSLRGEGDVIESDASDSSPSIDAPGSEASDG